MPRILCIPLFMIIVLVASLLATLGDEASRNFLDPLEEYDC